MKLQILGFVSFRESKRSLVAFMLQWRNRSRCRRQLLDLDDRMLRDIGLTRYDVLHGKSSFSDLVRHPE